jgi:trk system potassium uptake protein TrkH
MLGILHVLAVAVAGLFALIVPAVLFAIADGMRDLALPCFWSVRSAFLPP